MDMDDPLVTIRMQYVEDLEDILQCPVCWELPSGLIFTCMKGHHICEHCQTKDGLNVCPSCESNFNGSRNYLAESLSSKFDDIKNSILDPAHRINRKIVKKHIETQTASTETISVNTQTEVDNNSVSTQTNFSECSIETQTELNVIDVGTQMDEQLQPNTRASFMVKENHNVTVGAIKEDSTSTKDNNYTISCLLESCEDKCSYDNIVRHIELNHKEHLMKVNLPKNDGLYRTEWNILYGKGTSFDYAIDILDIGLIFFNVSIDPEGNLFGNIEVVKYYGINEQQLYYLLMITNSQNGLLSEVFKGVVPSYLCEKNNNTDNIFISGASFSRYLLNEKKRFDCSLTLYRPEDF
ncbi:uncharacterized protein LOC100679077 [Nasonia vitripennis]|uniref:E3 ubiquitin-protein ligase Sina-like RING finger domain-containing protein n=1 Tax=Nasonia vitripennis TaxID=7425 RepID=A0A7M7QA38_NASVI|nr:uncharacterized protein LOC100679077 [Nasonia vitripennis]XP_031784140.1 uncharacterized protein LOC100679077 [Nasonia vitripennis]